MGNNMKRLLTREVRSIYHYKDGVRVDGAPKSVSGDLTNIRGDLTYVRGDLTGIRGNLTGIRGNLTGIHGDLTGVHGDLTDITGNLDGCEITAKMREHGIDIKDLILETVTIKK